MPTKRTRFSRNLIPEIRPEELYFLSDGLMGVEPKPQDLRLFLLQKDDKALRVLWSEHHEAILSEWISQHPGRRPSLWWRFSAPRISAESVAQLGRGAMVGGLHREDFCEPRARLGGIGTPNHECLNYWPSFSLGIPDCWVSAWSESYYNGRSRDIHGNPIGTEYHEGDFEGKAIDPANPPTFESQAAYLRRLGLFAAGEEKRLKPADFEPEAIGVELEEEEAGTIQ